MKSQKTKATVLLSDAPFSSHSAYDAYEFCTELLSKNQGRIQSLFFFSDSVYLANSFAETPYDEFNLVDCLLELNEQYGLNLHLCVGACQKRGIMNSEMANKTEQVSNLQSGFDTVGLIRLYQSIIQSDQLVIFKKNRKLVQSVKKEGNLWVIYPETLPYESYYFRELLELALAIASFDEKVYFVIDGLAQEKLSTKPPVYSKDLSKMIQSASHFGLEIINQNDYQALKAKQKFIEFN